MGDLSVEERAKTVVVRVHAQPKASKTEFAGLHGGRLKVRIQAPPVDGAANKALVRFLAKASGVPRSCVIVTRGAASRSKEVTIDCQGADAPPGAITERLRRAGAPPTDHD